MALQHSLDLIHVGLHLGILRLKGIQRIGGLAEKAHDALGRFLGGVEALKLRHQARDHLADLAQVLGADIFQRAAGKIGHFFLAGRAVLQHHRGIAQVDFFREFVHCLFLFGRKARVHGLRLHCRFLFLLRRGGGLRVQRQCGNGGNREVWLQGKRGCGLFFFHDRFVPF